MSYQQNTYYSRRQQNWSRNQNTTRFVSAIKLGPVAHTILIALMITVLGLIYLTQATRTSGYGYEAQQIDEQVSIAQAKAKAKDKDGGQTALEKKKLAVRYGDRPAAPSCQALTAKQAKEKAAAEADM